MIYISKNLQRGSTKSTTIIIREDIIEIEVLHQNAAARGAKLMFIIWSMKKVKSTKSLQANMDNMKHKKRLRTRMTPSNSVRIKILKRLLKFNKMKAKLL
jgi:hypothetical protein